MIRRHDIPIAPFIDIETDEFGYETTNYGEIFVVDGVTLNSLSGYTEMQMFGTKIARMCKTLVDYEQWLGKINEKDVAYLYGASPEGEKNIGDNANYTVTAVLPQNKKIAIYFEKRVDKK